jgi:nitrate reductase NapAB chaperone NapD
MSLEKVSSIVFSHSKSLKKRKRRLQGVPFLEIVYSVQKRGKLALERRLFKTILTSVTKIRSLDNIFNFKASKKSLTMDSHPFCDFSLLIPKRYKIY